MARPIIPRPVIVPIGPSIAYIELNHGYYALIDSEDAEKVGQYNWLADYAKGTGTFYARTHAAIDGRKSSRLHQFIMDFHKNFTDHQNGNTLDCRKINLRKATRMENIWNSKSPCTNKTGIKGAQWCKRDRRFYSYITANKIKYWLGTFVTAEEAGIAYTKAAESLHGEFAFSRGVGGV